MAGYRGPQPQRIAAQQASDVYRYGGYPVTWRDYVGTAAAPNEAAGLGKRPLYAEHTITALFGPIEQPETQTMAGVFAAASILMTTRERVQRQDQIVWRGITYSVDADPAPDPLTSAWNTVINRRKI